MEFLVFLYFCEFGMNSQSLNECLSPHARRIDKSITQLLECPYRLKLWPLAWQFWLSLDSVKLGQ